LGLQMGGSDANPYFSHGGANEGFRNIFVAYEKNGDGAAVMTNGDNGGQIGDEIMHSIAIEYHWPDWHPDVRTAIQIDSKVLARYVGTYQLGPNFDLVVTLENGQLISQATGQPKFVLYAKSQTNFFPLEFPAELEFVTDDKGAVTAMVLHQG